jgi:hypothetical protein
MSDQGFVKIHRRLLKWKFSDNPEFLVVWIHLLLMASHNDHKTACGNQIINLKSGQLITGREKLSKATGVSVQRIRTILNTLEIDQQINQQTFSKYRIISIVKWDMYQINNQQINQQLTSNQPTTNQQLTTIQEGKEVKEKILKTKGTKPTFELPSWIPSEQWNAFVAMRKEIKKPITGRAADLAVSKLEELQKSGNDPGAVLDQSTFNSWQGLFAIKADYQAKTRSPIKTFEQIKMDNTVDAMKRFLERGEDDGTTRPAAILPNDRGTLRLISN